MFASTPAARPVVALSTPLFDHKTSVNGVLCIKENSSKMKAK
jgi:hypothetical protein